VTLRARKAFVLLRVSSSGQTRRAGAEEGYSIEMQRDRCTRNARELGAEIAGEWVAPAESASRGFYKTLTEMIAALKARGDIAYVIVYKLERFARDELTDFAAYAEIKQAGAELVSATEGIDGSPQGMLMHGVLAAFNAYFSRDLAQKITDGRVTKAKLGGTPGRTTSARSRLTLSALRISSGRFRRTPLGSGHSMLLQRSCTSGGYGASPPRNGYRDGSMFPRSIRSYEIPITSARSCFAVSSTRARTRSSSRRICSSVCSRCLPLTTCRETSTGNIPTI
jgi:DNA invertase Pin-like site-specific DNA recombinase